MLTIFIKFDPATAALITRVLDAFDASQQSQVNAMTAQATAALAKLKASQTALQGTLNQ